MREENKDPRIGLAGSLTRSEEVKTSATAFQTRMNPSAPQGLLTSLADDNHALALSEIYS